MSRSGLRLRMTSSISDTLTSRLIYLIFAVLFFVIAMPGQALECYRNDGLGLEIREIRCPTNQEFCLKANVYDGRVIRDCASASSCPQGNGCAPITYENDGTTDFVCCCTGDFCNSAISKKLSTGLFLLTLTVPTIITIVTLFKIS